MNIARFPLQVQMFKIFIYFQFFDSSYLRFKMYNKTWSFFYVHSIQDVEIFFTGRIKNLFAPNSQVVAMWYINLFIDMLSSFNVSIVNSTVPTIYSSSSNSYKFKTLRLNKIDFPYSLGLISCTFARKPPLPLISMLCNSTCIV